MGRRVQATLRRSGDLVQIHSERLARELIAQPQQVAANLDDIISSLAKWCLGRLETAASVGLARPRSFKGIGSALGALKGRWHKTDASVMVRRVRSLHEAAGFVRHLTECGVDSWKRDLDCALSRLTAKDEDGGDASMGGAAEAEKEDGDIDVG